MPKVVSKEGKTRHFAYSKAGMRAAKEYAKQTGGRMTGASMKSKMAKKKDAGYGKA
jgi:hypothetical protein